jgi:preprotein translocase subunit YajC
MNLTPLLALIQDAPPASDPAAQGGGGGSPWSGPLMMVVVFAIFYFLLIRPQSKERQRHEQMLQKIKKGDEIVMNGGIIGKVVHVEEKRLTLKTAENTRLTVDRSRIAAVLDTRGEEQEGSKKDSE